jgi:hypothetical protein
VNHKKQKNGSDSSESDMEKEKNQKKKEKKEGWVDFIIHSYPSTPVSRQKQNQNLTFIRKTTQVTSCQGTGTIIRDSDAFREQGKNTERFNRKPVRLCVEKIRNRRNTPDIIRKQVRWINPDRKASHMLFQGKISHVKKQNRLSGKIIPLEGKPCIYGSFTGKTGSSLQGKKICSDL